MVLDFKDESLTECLNDIISGLLPHDEYDSANFGLLYPSLKMVLGTEDARGLYWLFYRVFDKYFSIASSMPKGQFKINLTRDRFSNALANNLPDFILDPKLDVPTLMAEEGKSSDITLPTVQQEIMGVVYEKAIGLYDECFELAKSYEDAMSRVIDLRDVIKANLIETGFGMQRTIMSTGLRLGRRNYLGTSGWLEYVQHLARQVSEMENQDDDDLVCDGIDVALSTEQSNKELKEPLAGYGIPQLDDKTPMLKHRLCVLVGKENTGKTRIIIHLIAKLIREGVKPFFACGESVAGLMLDYIISSYIYQEYNMFFETQYLSGEGFESLDPAEQQVVNAAKARVASSGLVISTNLTYDNVTSKITNYYNMGCEAFFIDHTLSLRGRMGRKTADLVTGLALDCRDLKNALPIYIMLASQPSTDLKDLLQKDQTSGIQQNVTAHSATPTQEADEVFIITENEYLRTQGLLKWIVHKRRDANAVAPLYVLKHFDVSAFEYDAKYQGVDSQGENSIDVAVRKIAADEGMSMDLDDDDDDDGDELSVTF